MTSLVPPHGCSMRLVSRRAWLDQQTRAAVLTALAPSVLSRMPRGRPGRLPCGHATSVSVRGGQGTSPGPGDAWKQLVRQAIDAATAAGASYVDARLTRTVSHKYDMAGNGRLMWEEENLGLGVRTLVQGCWGFAASPYATPAGVVQLARDAVGQAKESATATTRPVELGAPSTVTGHWATPVSIDPFAIPIEEKLDHIRYWKDCVEKEGYQLYGGGGSSWLRFHRQERVLATSTGSLVTQTLYETEGVIQVQYEFANPVLGTSNGVVELTQLDAVGRGWEMLLDAKIPEQISQRVLDAQRLNALPSKHAMLGRYSLVLDGRTMAALLHRTVGAATQLDRALGYEANASGTSFIDDPFSMVGTFSVASPLVTVTANRSASTQLATVQWDDEGVVPEPFPLVKEGVLVDFQTTREQAAWMAPYYQRQRQPVRSHGCAAAQDALFPALQMMPNLALAPSASAIGLEDLVKGIPDGIFIEDGIVNDIDFQARNGILTGQMRQITNGRLGAVLVGGAVQFNTLDFWRHLQAVGGAATAAVVSCPSDPLHITVGKVNKGEPAQATSYSAQAVAAIVPNQPVINPRR